MPCPLCTHPDSRVLRTSERDNGQIRRTRQCVRCGHRWPTVEIAESEAQQIARVRAAAGALLEAIGAP